MLALATATTDAVIWAATTAMTRGGPPGTVAERDPTCCSSPTTALPTAAGSDPARIPKLSARTTTNSPGDAATSPVLIGETSHRTRRRTRMRPHATKLAVGQGRADEALIGVCRALESSDATRMPCRGIAPCLPAHPPTPQGGDSTQLEYEIVVAFEGVPIRTGNARSGLFVPRNNRRPSLGTMHHFIVHRTKLPDVTLSQVSQRQG
jgi:hypothetical protein